MELMNIWNCEKRPLTELLSTIIDNRGKTVPTVDNGRILIATNCVTNNTLFPVYEKVRFISDEIYHTWFRGHPTPGDILFVNKGTPGRVCLVPDPIDFSIAQDMIALRADDTKVYNKYLLAVLRSDRIQRQIYNTSVGDVIPHFKKQFLNQLLIPIPDRKVQEFIGDLYYNLSYKVEHNNRINHNLEQQAQIVFDRIFNSDLTNNCLLSSIVDINPKRMLRKNEVARCIDMTYLNTAGSFPSGWEFKPYSGGMKFINGDTLMARITPCLENGKVAYINFLDKEETAFGSTEYIVFHAKEGYPNEMFYFLTRNKAFIEFATKNMNGSSGRQRVSGETIGNYIIPVLSEDDISELKAVSESTMKEILKNNLESRVLSEMRNAILPKLMSGELKINDLTC